MKFPKKNSLVLIQITFSLIVNSCDAKKSHLTFASNVDNCLNCNIENLRKLRVSTESPDANAIGTFLMCCNKLCALDVEYSQASNYSLFKLVQDYPDVFLNTIIDKVDSLDLPYIKSMLENPVSDDIDLDKTIEALKMSSISSMYKSELLESLTIASEK